MLSYQNECGNVSHSSHIADCVRDEKNILGGLEIGADAYITKPFSVGILKVTIKNILANRELLRQVYNSIENKEKHLPVNCTNTLDWKFIASVKECIEKNMEIWTLG